MSETLARAYFKVLVAVDWADPVVVGGLREGLNKFLSNAHLAMLRGRNKYHKTHWVSQQAMTQLDRREYHALVFEHIVPKAAYIQAPCERLAQAGDLTVDFIVERLAKYWHLATVTRREDQLLSRLEMPESWDSVDVQARYRAAGLVLLPNPYFGGEEVHSRPTTARSRRRPVSSCQGDGRRD